MNEEMMEELQGIDKRAKESNERAHRGIVRAGKEKLVESIVEQLVRIAWENLRMEEIRSSFPSHKIKIPNYNSFRRRNEGNSLIEISIHSWIIINHQF